MAGNTARARVGRRHRTRKPSRSRRRRFRDNVVHNLISYVVWFTYLGLGIAVADGNHYLDIDQATDGMPVISAVAAVLFWPLVFLGTNVRA